MSGALFGCSDKKISYDGIAGCDGWLILFGRMGVDRGLRESAPFSGESPRAKLIIFAETDRIAYAEAICSWEGKYFI